MSTVDAPRPRPARPRPARRRLLRTHGRRFWAPFVAAGLVFLFYVPALIATQYTAERSSPDFLSRPLKGWQFLYTAMTKAPDAELNTSGLASARAHACFDEGPVIGGARVVRVRLIYGDGATVPVTGGGIRTPGPLAWEVKGRVGEGRSRLWAVLDYDSGRTLWKDPSVVEHRERAKCND